MSITSNGKLANMLAKEQQSMTTVDLNKNKLASIGSQKEISSTISKSDQQPPQETHHVRESSFGPKAKIDLKPNVSSRNLDPATAYPDLPEDLVRKFLMDKELAEKPERDHTEVLTE